MLHAELPDIDSYPFSPDSCRRASEYPFISISTRSLTKRKLILTVSLLWFNLRIARDSREQRGSVELVRSSNECIGDFESTEEAMQSAQVVTLKSGQQNRSAVCQIDSGWLVC
jgi:hypothetical protein